MANPVTDGSALIVQATLAIQSCKSLCETIESFKSHQRHVRELKEELEALETILLELNQVLQTTYDEELDLLELPLNRCSEACKGFESLLLHCITNSNRLTFRDWVKIRYMGNDVHGFKNVLAGYKSTITIALCSISLRDKFVTPNVLYQYSEMIKDTATDLKDRLRELDENIQAMSFFSAINMPADRGRAIEQELLSIRNCIEVCDQASGEAEKAPGILYKDATSSEDSCQVIFSTIGNLISARHVTAGARSAQLIGAMSDEHLHSISQGRHYVLKPDLAEHPRDTTQLGINFSDALGRKFKFRWNYCNTWNRMEKLILEAYKDVEDVAGGEMVRAGLYDLRGPEGEVILPVAWEDVVKPGWSVTMHLWPKPPSYVSVIGADSLPLGDKTSRLMTTSETAFNWLPPELRSGMWSQGRCDEAEKLQVEVMEKSKIRTGDDHPNALRSMANLPAAYPPIIPALPEVKTFFRNPSEYLEKIMAIGTEIIDYLPDWNPKIEPNPEQAPVHIELPEIDIAHLERFLEQSRTKQEFVIRSFLKLRHEKLISDCYNIMVQDSNRERVACVIPISFEMLESILELTVEALSSLKTSEYVKEDEILPIFDNLTNAATMFEAYIGCSNHSRANRPKSKIKDTLRRVDLLTNLLVLGVISFVDSHCGTFLQSALSDPSEIICSTNRCGSFSLRPRRLACLDAFVKRPVWVFHLDLGPRSELALFLSISVSDFSDLWGPVQLVYVNTIQESYMSSSVRQIDVMGGTIYGTVFNAKTHPRENEDEVLCHLIPWSHIESQSIERRENFDHLKKMLLGADPARDLEQSCSHGQSFEKNLDWFTLETSEDNWKIDTWSAGFSLTKLVGSNFGFTKRLHPGTTLKDLIMKDWVIETGRNENHDPDLDYLRYRVVLLISRCTGNATRITLSQLLEDPGICDYVERELSGGHEYANLMKKYRCFPRIWNMSAKNRKLLLRVVTRILSRTKDTGYNGGFIYVWSGTGVLGRKFSPSWCTVVRDECFTSTFALMTSQCFEFGSVYPTLSRFHCSNTHLMTTVVASPRKLSMQPENIQSSRSLQNLPHHESIENSSKRDQKVSAMNVPNVLDLDTRCIDLRKRNTNNFVQNLRTACKMKNSKTLPGDQNYSSIYPNYGRRTRNCVQSDVSHAITECTIWYLNSGKGHLELIGNLDDEHAPGWYIGSKDTYQTRWNAYGLKEQIGHRADCLEHSADCAISARLKSWNVQLNTRHLVNFKEQMRPDVDLSDEEALIHVIIS